MSPQTTHRDRGMTLIELIVTVSLIGLVTTVIAAAIIVVFRTEDGVIASTAESHDTQQVVSYLPLDIESGPRRASSYRATIGGAVGDPGSGCEETGTQNVLRIDVTDRRLDNVDKRIAYRVVTTADETRLDRYECREDTSVTPSVWIADSVVNVADFLDPDAMPVAESEIFLVNPSETDPNRQVVSRIEVRYVQRGKIESINAAPREEQQLSVDGVCAQDPLEAAQNMAMFFERDVTLNNSVGKGALYVGGTLTFNNSEVAQAVPPAPTAPVPADTGLLARSIDWAGSTGSLEVKQQRGVVIEDGVFSVSASSGLQRIIAGPSAPATPEITAASSASVAGGSGTPIVNASEAFQRLRACSDRLAALPGSCDNGNCAKHVDTINNTSWSTIRLDLVDGLANVLNISEAQLAALQDETISFVSGRTPTADRPLIINVKSVIGGTVSFRAPGLQGGGASAEYVLWNFPNASAVNLLDGTSSGRRLYGTLFAPYADVTSDEDIEGGVVASTVVINNSTLHDVRYFRGTLDW